MGIIEAIEITRDVAASNWHADDEQRQAMAMVADLIAAYDLLEPKERLRLEEALYAVAPHLRLTPADIDEIDAELADLAHEAEYQRTLDAGFTDVCPICGQQH